MKLPNTIWGRGYGRPAVSDFGASRVRLEKFTLIFEIPLGDHTHRGVARIDAAGRKNVPNAFLEYMKVHLLGQIATNGQRIGKLHLKDCHVLNVFKGWPDECNMSATWMEKPTDFRSY